MAEGLGGSRQGGACPSPALPHLPPALLILTACFPQTPPPQVCPQRPCPPSSCFQATSLALKSLKASCTLNSCSTFSHRYISLGLLLPDFNCYLDPSISASLCLSLPPSPPLTVPMSPVHLLLGSASPLTPTVAPFGPATPITHHSDLGTGTHGAWGPGLGFEWRSGGARKGVWSPSSAPRETRVPVTWPRGAPLSLPGRAREANEIGGWGGGSVRLQGAEAATPRGSPGAGPAGVTSNETIVLVGAGGSALEP